MKEIINENSKDNKEVQEPELITTARNQLDFIIYVFLVSLFQLVSMIYILYSKKITFYCNYTLFNRSNK